MSNKTEDGLRKRIRDLKVERDMALTERDEMAGVKNDALAERDESRERATAAEHNFAVEHDALVKAEERVEHLRTQLADRPEPGLK